MSLPNHGIKQSNVFSGYIFGLQWLIPSDSPSTCFENDKFFTLTWKSICTLYMCIYEFTFMVLVVSITNEINVLHTGRSYQIWTTLCIIFSDASTAILVSYLYFTIIMKLKRMNSSKNLFVSYYLVICRLFLFFVYFFYFFWGEGEAGVGGLVGYCKSILVSLLCQASKHLQNYCRSELTITGCNPCLYMCPITLEYFVRICKNWVFSCIF